jgi:hypothetical protein
MYHTTFVTTCMLHEKSSKTVSRRRQVLNDNLRFGLGIGSDQVRVE